MKNVKASLVALGLGFVLFGCGPQEAGMADDPAADEVGRSEEALLSGTCTSAYHTECIGKAYYSSPDGGAHYCDPMFTGGYDCGWVARGNCNFQSSSTCGGHPQGSMCNYYRGHCVAVTSDPTPSCGCY